MWWSTGQEHFDECQPPQRELSEFKLQQVWAGASQRRHKDQLYSSHGFVLVTESQWATAVSDSTKCNTEQHWITWTLYCVQWLQILSDANQTKLPWISSIFYCGL